MQVGFMCLHEHVEYHLEVKHCQNVHVSSYRGTFTLIICMQSCTYMYCIWVKEINLHQIEFSVFPTNKFWIPLFTRFWNDGRESMLYIWSHWIPHKTFLVELQIDIHGDHFDLSYIAVSFLLMPCCQFYVSLELIGLWRIFQMLLEILTLWEMLYQVNNR